MNKRYDVVIVGGGINGCGLAYNLAKKKFKVAVFEKKYLASGNTGACGAGIRQQWSTRENTKLAIDSVKIFEKLTKELGENIELRQGGYLIIVHNKEEMKQAQKNVQMQKSLGLKVEILQPEEINDVVSILDVEGTNAIGATFCPTDGHANPFKTTFSYAQAARRFGADIFTHTKVLDVKTKNKQVSEVVTQKGIFKTDYVVNAAGIDSKSISKMVGISIPNTPYRKEIMATERLKPLFEAMVISFKDGIYFSQQQDGQIVGGIPIPQEKSGYKTMPTIDFLEHMSRTLTDYAPVLKHVNMLRHWTGFYDITPDARPILGESKKIKGFIQCNGFSGHGFMLSPMVTKMLSKYISTGEESQILKKLKLERFKGKKIDKEMSVVG